MRKGATAAEMVEVVHKARLLATLDEALARGRSALQPEAWRAL